MRFVIFCHSLRSDWNHGNAHFLRGIATELIERGHRVAVYEPQDAWSLQHLVAAHGTDPIDAFHAAYPRLHPVQYDASIRLEDILDGADVVLVHEWSDPDVVARIGALRRQADFTLLFHDTHHRAATAPDEMMRYDLRDFDGVLAFGSVIRDIYLERGWVQQAWTWHEAADVRVFHPVEQQHTGDVVWIGNWGDDERTRELREFLIDPVHDLLLQGTVHGVRYPADAVDLLQAAGMKYGGWLPNFEVPQLFARHRVTIHVPRWPYVTALPGIPTIRPFEALACGIPLISAPWDDVEQLFRAGSDYLVARDGVEMRRLLRDVLNDEMLAAALARNGRGTILDRHTCAHRVDELLSICGSLAPERQELITT